MTMICMCRSCSSSSSFGASDVSVVAFIPQGGGVALGLAVQLELAVNMGNESQLEFLQY